MRSCPACKVQRTARFWVDLDCWLCDRCYQAASTPAESCPLCDRDVPTSYQPGYKVRMCDRCYQWLGAPVLKRPAAPIVVEVFDGDEDESAWVPRAPWA